MGVKNPIFYSTHYINKAILWTRIIDAPQMQVFGLRRK